MPGPHIIANRRVLSTVLATSGPLSHIGGPQRIDLSLGDHTWADKRGPSTVLPTIDGSLASLMGPYRSHYHLGPINGPTGGPH